LFVAYLEGPLSTIWLLHLRGKTLSKQPPQKKKKRKTLKEQEGCFRFLSHTETKPNTSSQKWEAGPSLLPPYVPMMTIGFLSYPGFDFCNFFPSFRFLFGVFVLHVVVSFSPLVYNFNKILLTNSGEWSAESAMTRQRKSRVDCTDCGHFYTSYTSATPPKGIDIIITITTKWRVGRVGSSNCSNCLSALYLSILQLTLLALHTFKAL